MHINKNAGHTVRNLLRQVYSDQPGLDTMVRGRSSLDGGIKSPQSGDLDVVHLVAEIRSRQHELAYLACNLSYGVDYFLDRPAAYFAFLREPVDRCKSYWHFAHAVRDDHPLWSTLEAHDFDFDKILSNRVAPQFSNDQVRMITGARKLHVDSHDLQLAKQFIRERYLFVGDVASFDASVNYLARALGWEGVPQSEPLNVVSRADTDILPAGADESFARANQLDAELYSWLVTDYLPGAS
jgi:hypothetical protein